MMIGSYSSKTANMMARQNGGLGFQAHLSTRRPGEGPRYKVPHLTFPNHYWFPNQGDADILYIDREDNSVYRWDSIDNKYFLIGFNPANIKGINCGGASDDEFETSENLPFIEGLEDEVDDEI